MVTNFDDTIAGISTAPGIAGISVIRVSGEAVFKVINSLFRSKKYTDVAQIPDKTIAYGWIEAEGKPIDEVLLSIMHKPHTFTAEDIVEIHCHGGMYISQTILKMVLEQGVRLANPGEFTQRAFVNGRIDLTQAEAINDMINAKSALGLDLVVNQLKGKLYDRINAVKEKIAWVLALVNAGIDFPEEDTVFANRNEIADRLNASEVELENLIRTAETGIKIREGYQIVLVGKPNVGKSSILNGVLSESRAIVHQMPGTTRDTIEESATIEGIPISIIDTAGIHETDDQVEQEGITRAFSAMNRADLIVWVIDTTAPSFDLEVSEQASINDTPILLVLNKTDLSAANSDIIPDRWKDLPCIFISALKERDLLSLRKEIFEFLSGNRGVLPEETMLTNIRQKRSTENALKVLREAKDAIEAGLGEEYLAVDLSQTLNALGEIVGETTPDDMLNQVFSQFCIGK